jgi:hypothetical protein
MVAGTLVLNWGLARTFETEPHRLTATAAGSAAASDNEVNSRKYAMALPARLAVIRFRG